MSSATQIPLSFDYRPAMSGEDFLVAPCNKDAVAWLDTYPDWPTPFLVIYGDPGCGKTHLVEVFSQATGAQNVTLSEDPYELMAGQYVGVLENVDQLLPTQQKDLFHLYNFARENEVKLLLTARSAPSKWSVDLADLKSRLGAVSIAEIGQPDDALMEAVLVKQFADRQLQVEREVIQYMLSRMERSFDVARQMVARIDEEALANKRKITVPLVRTIL